VSARVAATLGFAVAVGLVVAAVGQRTPPTAAAPGRVTISIIQRVPTEPPTWGFVPASITIPPGTIVTWRNVKGNSEFHTSTSYEDVWNSPVLNPGERWSLTFTKLGRFRYHCTPHPWMTGVITVAAGAPLPPPGPK
jgi:plastocyanin